MIRLWRLLLLCVTGCLATATTGQAADSLPIVTVLVAYHSLSGHTERMAGAVAEGARTVVRTQVTVNVFSVTHHAGDDRATAVLRRPPLVYRLMFDARGGGEPTALDHLGELRVGHVFRAHGRV